MFDDPINRNRIKKVLDNIHESLKWTWQLIMGFALITAVDGYFNYLHGSSSIIDGTLIHYFFGLFIFTFIRFLFGNNRYLDERYVEFFFQIEKLDDEKKLRYLRERTQKLSGLRRLYDILMLLSTGILFVMLGKTLNGQIELFISFYVKLMILNIILLFISIVWNFSIEVNASDPAYSDRLNFFLGIWQYEKYPAIWIINNMICLFIFLFLDYVHFFLKKELLFITIFYINSLIDISLTWKFYFPKIDISNT